MSREMTAEELVGEEWPCEGGLAGSSDEEDFMEQDEPDEISMTVLTAQGRPPSAAIFPEIAQNRKMVWVTGKKMEEWFEIHLLAMLKGAVVATPENLKAARCILVMRFERPSLRCLGCNNSHPALTIVARGKTCFRMDSPEDPDFWAGIGTGQLEELLM